MGQTAKRERQRWKMTASEVISSTVLIPGDAWSPLDGGSAPEYIPEAWDGVHVSVRLIEGFKTLACMPNKGRHGTASGFWPDTWPTWEDMLAQTTADVDTREQDAELRNRVRLRPNAQEVSRMEVVLMWPAKFLVPKSIPMARIVQNVAYMRSKEYDLGMIARKLRLGPRHLRRINREGLDIIAAGLRMTGVAVF